MENLGVNFDPANLLMYGKANSVDALNIFGRYVRGFMPRMMNTQLMVASWVGRNLLGEAE